MKKERKKKNQICLQEDFNVLYIYIVEKYETVIKLVV